MTHAARVALESSEAKMTAAAWGAQQLLLDVSHGESTFLTGSQAQAEVRAGLGQEPAHTDSCSALTAAPWAGLLRGQDS